MRNLIQIPIVIIALIFELIGRVLHQIAEVSMGAAIIMLGAINGKKD